MTMQYAHIVDGEVLSAGPPPRWLTDDGEPLTESEWAEHDRFPVQDADPIPEGKISTGREVEIIDGKPKWVETLIDTPKPTGEEVNRARDMRMREPFSFNGSIFAKSSASAGAQAAYAMTQGAEVGDYRWYGGDSDYTIVDADDGLHIMDAPTVYAMSKAATERDNALSIAARVMRDNPPADYADEEAWARPATAAIIPAAGVMSANADLESQGFGPRVFSSPAYTGPEATHATMMSMGRPDLVDAVAELPDVDTATGSDPIGTVRGLTESAGAVWGDAVPMLPDEGLVMPGEMYRADGSRWTIIQQFDRSTYGEQPDEYPALIRRVRNPMVVEEWRQPTDQYDAYNLVNPFTGEPDRAIWEGDTHKTLIDANVWSPGDHAAGWQLIED